MKCKKYSKKYVFSLLFTAISISMYIQSIYKIWRLNILLLYEVMKQSYYWWDFLSITSWHIHKKLMGTIYDWIIPSLATEIREARSHIQFNRWGHLLTHVCLNWPIHIVKCARMFYNARMRVVYITCFSAFFLFDVTIYSVFINSNDKSRIWENRMIFILYFFFSWSLTKCPIISA